MSGKSEVYLNACSSDWKINKSINESNFYSANILSIARLSGATAESVFNSEIDELVLYHQRASGCAGVCGREAKSKRCVLRRLSKVATEVAEWADNVGGCFKEKRCKSEGARVNCSHFTKPRVTFLNTIHILSPVSSQCVAFQLFHWFSSYIYIYYVYFFSFFGQRYHEHL